MTKLKKLKEEIFNPSSCSRDVSTITCNLAETLKKGTYTEKEFADYFRDYAELIGDREIHVNAACSRLLVWAFEEKNARWDALFNQVEKIIDHLEKQKIEYGAMILHESIAHRYVEVQKIEKAEKHYNKAYEIALKLGRKKNMDSSMYYAYRALKDIDSKKAMYYAMKFVTNKNYFRHSNNIKNRKECFSFILGDVPHGGL